MLPPLRPSGTPTPATDAAAAAKRQIPGVPTLPQSKFLSQPNPLQQKQAAAAAAAAAAGGGQTTVGSSSSSGTVMGLPPQQAAPGGPGMGLPPLSPMTPAAAAHHGHHGHPHHDHDHGHAPPSAASVAAAAAAAAAKILLQRRRVSGYEMEKDLARYEEVWGKVRGPRLYDVRTRTSPGEEGPGLPYTRRALHGMPTDLRRDMGALV